MSKEEDFYKKIRTEISDWIAANISEKKYWSDFLLLVPDVFYLLMKLSLDKEFPVNKKLKLAALIAYFISPIDLMPELILGPIGFLDDLVASAYVLNEIINDENTQLVKKHWAGDKDILYVIKNIIANADHLVGEKIINKLKQKFSPKSK
ncbi:MAG: hypothetical protein CO129_09165 [Ignavibacteriales bacterium CG_4_9_14_3_um_filter_34_10]|nr:MAG: hypothetical protein CO129_09165 [Ignavibacteriales bacterium CG_4_9_14_3_um_filter_34_10]